MRNILTSKVQVNIYYMVHLHEQESSEISESWNIPPTKPGQ